MTLRSLAFSNIRGSWRAYSTFFMSSVFAVMIFYMYAAFLAHPEVVNGRLEAASNVRKGMVLCEAIIVIFSFLFVLYSTTVFLKKRKREFGLLSLLGMTRLQLCKIMIYEHLAIAILAIGSGIGLGILFSKLFFMALAVLLRMTGTLAFAVPLQAVFGTAGGFLVLFAWISTGTALWTSKTPIISLLQASRWSKSLPSYSRSLSVLSILSLGAAYGSALLMNGDNFEPLAVVTLLTVTVGTYLFYSQASILMLQSVQKRYSVYYNRTNMLVLAQLGNKIKDNALMLCIVSILSAVIVTASGTIYMMERAVELQDIQTQYVDTKGFVSLTMLFGMFISLLFFIASGSITYFRQYSELQEDEGQYKTLTRIGVTRGEIRTVIVTQIGFVFFVPCLIGIAHALVALKALDSLLALSSWVYCFVVIGIYVAMQMLYFFITCGSYMKSIYRRSPLQLE